MAYTNHEWQDGELITPENLNRIEDGITEASQKGGRTTFLAWSSSPDGSQNFTTKGRSVSKNIIPYPKQLINITKIGNITLSLSDFDQTTKMLHLVSAVGSGATVGFFINTNTNIESGTNWAYGVDILNTTNKAKISRFWVEGSKSSSGNNLDIPVSTDWVRYNSIGVSSGTSKNAVLYFDTTNAPLDLYVKLPKLAFEKQPSPFTPSPVENPYYDGNLPYQGVCYSETPVQPQEYYNYSWSPANDIFIDAKNIEGAFDYLLIQSPDGSIYKETIDDTGNITMTKQ